MNDYYTCPMHPEIKESKPGKCPKCGGMDLVLHSSRAHQDHEHKHEDMMSSPEAAADFLKRFIIVTVLLLPLVLFSAPALRILGVADFTFRPFIEFFIATGIFYFGLIFFQHARHEVMMKKYGMMTLVSLGVGSGYLFSAAATFIPAISTEFYLEISTLIWVLLFGHFLEAKSSTAAGDALQEVAALLPKEAHVKSKEGFNEVSIDKLNEGDIVLVKAGEKVPADGTIVSGGGSFNQAHLTGEAKPVTKKVGDELAAGSISIDGSVEVKLLRVGESSTIGQIKALISQAKQTKPSAQRLADRAAGWLTFSALTISILTLLIWTLVIGKPLVFAATLAITVLVIACPHALGLAIPTVSTIATKLAVKNGIFLKDMAKIEEARKIDYVVFDKTGTLTQGKFSVSEVRTLSGDEDVLLSVAGAIESQSSHVIGLAVMDHMRSENVTPLKAENVKNLAGRGMEATVSGQKYFVGNKRLMEELKVWSKGAESALNELSGKGHTVVFVADGKNVLGIIALRDQLKPESSQAVAQLHKMGVKVAMLTGDTLEAAQPVAVELKIDNVFAGVLPEDKYKYIENLQDEGHVVLMTGDGVNDAPALTQANVGVAVGAGTDVAVEAGDVVLTQSNPQHIVRLLILSKKVYAKMLQNLWWALGYNIVALPAAAGLFVSWGFRLTPAVGALLMSLSSVIVVVNALGLKKAKLKI